MSNEVKRYDPINSDGTCGMCIEDADYGAYVEYADYAALEAENAKLRAELERRAVDDHTEQALAMVPVKPTQAMISAGWRVGLMGMDRDGPQAIYAAMLAAAPSAPKTDDPVKVQLLEALEELLAVVEQYDLPLSDPERIAARAAIAAARQEGGKV